MLRLLESDWRAAGFPFDAIKWKNGCNNGRGGIILPDQKNDLNEYLKTQTTGHIISP